MKQTQLQNTFDKSLIDKDLKKKEEDKSAKSFIFGALRKISGGSRKTSKVCNIKYFLSTIYKYCIRNLKLQLHPLHLHHQKCIMFLINNICLRNLLHNQL